MRTDAKQEILDIVNRPDDILSESDIERINAILSTHTLEPIDDRPFDPTLCGFKLIKSEIHRINGYRVWVKDGLEITKLDDGYGEYEQQDTGAIRIPWPATQSDGERLLKLLGVLR